MESSEVKKTEYGSALVDLLTKKKKKTWNEKFPRKMIMFQSQFINRGFDEMQ